MSRWNFQRRPTLHLLCHLGFGPAIHSSSTVFGTWTDRRGKKCISVYRGGGKKTTSGSTVPNSSCLSVLQDSASPTDVSWSTRHAKISSNERRPNHWFSQGFFRRCRHLSTIPNYSTSGPQNVHSRCGPCFNARLHGTERPLLIGWHGLCRARESVVREFVDHPTNKDTSPARNLRWNTRLRVGERPDI